jgi:serine/threonine protein phosphatase 1
VYAVGDIHGRLDLLLLIEAAIEIDLAENPTPTASVCFLGDYIDRGPASAGVIEHMVTSAPRGIRRIFIKGNHEDRFLAFLEDPERNGPGWIEFGGREALESYGVRIAEGSTQDWTNLRDKVAMLVPPRHIKFIERLQLAVRWRGYIFVHAGLDPAKGLEAQESQSLMWIREPFLSSDREWGLRVVHGHVIEPEPVFRVNRIGLDTGAYKSGILTCAALDGQEIRIIQVSIDDTFAESS